MHELFLTRDYIFRIGMWFFFLMAACSDDELSNPYAYPEENALHYTKSHTLIEGPLTKVRIDHQLSIDYTDLQYHEAKNGRAYLSLFDPNGPVWYLYGYPAGEILNRVEFALEGPDGIGSNTMNLGSFIFNADTLIVHNYWSNELFVFDGQGKKLKTIKLPIPDEVYFSAMLTQAPAFSDGQNVFIPNIYQGIIGDQLIPSEKIPAFLVVDIQDGSSRLLGERSGIYDRGYHIAGSNSTVFGDYNQDKGEIIFSFKQDHNLYAINLEGETVRHPAASAFFRNIEPLSEDFRAGWELESNGDKKVGEYIRTYPKYGRVLYDPWRQVYYRFTQLPKNKEEYEVNPFQIKPSIIIMNAGFQKTGEVRLDSDNLYSSAKLFDAFVSEAGLVIPWKNDNSEDELNLMTLKLQNL